MTDHRAEPDGDVARIATLPESVRQRVVAVTADALERIPPDAVPAGLRPVLGFVRQRRARLAGTAISAALLDVGFRERVASVISPEHAALLETLGRGDPAVVDPVDVAAVSYLVRQPGWDKALTDALERVDVESRTSRADEEALVRARSQIDEVRAELDAVRARLKEQLASVKAENSDLRRKLGAERSRSRDAQAAAEEARAGELRAHEEARQGSGEARTETRRLRARVEELEVTARAVKASERDVRVGEALRARLLLDTLLDAAQGLRRELALPPVDVLPADLVAAGMDQAAPAADVPTRARADTDPAMLEELLSLPRAHLLVDGYNVTRDGWETSPLEAQRARLLRGLAPLAARTRAEVTVVFDGAELSSRPVTTAPRGVRVLFSPPGVTADEIVRDLAQAEPAGRPVVVVSSDNQVRGWARAAGCRSLPSQALLNLLARS